MTVQNDLNGAAKETAREWVKDNLEKLLDWHTEIWEYAEPAWREYRSAEWYVQRLREEGFTVEENSGSTLR